MKKIQTLILLSLVLTLMTGWAQNSPAYAKMKGTFDRDASYTCPENSLFSQLPVTLDYVYFGDDTYTYYRIADDYTVTKPFTTMRFWGQNYYNCAVGSSETFIIKFYDRNPIDPTIPGPEFTSFTMTVTPQPMNLSFGTDYQVDVTFPTTVTLLDGWVSLTRENPGDGCTFGWYANGYVGNSASYDGSWVPSGWQCAFCLGGGVKTPLSNWALIMGVVLIGTFVFIRYRRMV